MRRPTGTQEQVSAARAKYQVLAEEQPVQPLRVLDQLFQVGLAHYNVGEYDEASSILETVINERVAFVGSWDYETCEAANRRGLALYWADDLTAAAAMQKRVLDQLEEDEGRTSEGTLFALRNYMPTLHRLGEWRTAFDEAQPITEAWLATPERQDEGRNLKTLMTLGVQYRLICQVSMASAILTRVMRACIRAHTPSVFVKALLNEIFIVAPVGFVVRHWMPEFPESSARIAKHRSQR